MTQVTTGLEGLQAAVDEALKKYSMKVAEKLKKAAKETAKDTVTALKAGGPYAEHSGNYTKGWQTKTISESEDKIDIVIHNPKNPGLTHLLEKGHALAGGGRTSAFPHISVAEEQAISEYREKAKEAIGNA